MARQVTNYLASDGTSFEHEFEADKHEEKLQDAEKVATYISAAGLSKAQAGLLRKHIPGFLEYLNEGVLPVAAGKKGKPESPAA